MAPPSDHNRWLPSVLSNDTLDLLKKTSYTILCWLNDKDRKIEKAEQLCLPDKLRDLPERFGDWKNIHRRHQRWSQKGIWKLIFDHLIQDADNEYAMIDSTIVRARQHAASTKKKNA